MKIKHVAWNLFGLGIPLALALATIPLLVKALGMERFGLLSLAWGLINYAGVFDLGIGRATTQYIAQLRGLGQEKDSRHVLSVAARLTLIVGSIGALLLCVAAIADVQRFIKHTPGLESEITISICQLALILPMQAMSATFRGVNEAYENFREVSFIRIFLGGMNFLGPLVTSMFTVKLPWLVGSLLLSRAVAVFLYQHVAQNAIAVHAAKQPYGTGIESSEIRSRLFRFGGWVTVSSIVSPLLVQADRFVIAAKISAVAVAAYTLPYELVGQTVVVASAVSSVAFPTITRLMHEDPKNWIRIFNFWTIVVAGVMAMVALVTALILPHFLPWWVGREISPDSIHVGQILCLGVFANSIGSMYYARLHALGRSDITAKLHLLEFFIYIIGLPVLINKFGIVGAATAWSARMVLDAILLVVKCSSVHV